MLTNVVSSHSIDRRNFLDQDYDKTFTNLNQSKVSSWSNINASINSNDNKTEVTSVKLVLFKWINLQSSSKPENNFKNLRFLDKIWGWGKKLFLR